MTIEFPENISSVPSDEKLAPYECWFEFLKHGKNIEWSKEAKKDFGNIQLDTDFKTWWREHSHIFKSVAPCVIEEWDSRDDFKKCEEEGWIDDPGFAVITVHMDLPRKYIKAALNDWLEKKIPMRRDTKKFDDEFVVGYGFHRIPKLTKLKRVLAVYKAVERNNDPSVIKKRYLYELVDEVNKELDDNLKLKTTYKQKPDDKYDPLPVDKDHHTQVMSRYYNIAKQIMEHIGYGEFPVYDEKEEEDEN